MKRNLKKNEKTALYTAGALVVLILLWLVLLNPMRGEIASLKSLINKKRESLKTTHQLKVEYLVVENDLKKYRDIINHPNRKGFSLNRHVTDIEKKLNFISKDQKAENPKKLGTEYIKSTIDYTYLGKSLEEIISFLYDVENPADAISISKFDLKPGEKGKKFDLRISLSAVTKVEN